MKSIEFDHELAEAIRRGEKTSTWRVRDDKNLAVNDEVRFIDKVDPNRPETWKVFGVGHIERVIEKRLGDVSGEDMEGHQKFASQAEMLSYFQSFYDNEVDLSTPIKLIAFLFTPINDYNEAVITTESVVEVQVYADGGSRGNPGPSASGFVIVDPNTKKVLVDKGIYLGITTNNQAEYLALKYALEEALKMDVRKVEAYMDSMLVVNQLKGTFKVKNRDLWPIYEAVKNLIQKFEKVSVTHIPREMNKLADAAVNRAMDEEVGVKRPKLTS